MYNIITIERQFASGGHKIGSRLAKKLGYTFYNEEILIMAANKLGIPPEYIQHLEEAVSSGLLNTVSYLADFTKDANFSDKLFYAESEIIKKIARNEKCVIVGRCAGSILGDRKDCLKVFVYADEAARIKRAVDEYGVEESGVRSFLKKNDKRRTSYYNIRAEKKWSKMNTYDICLNSSELGLDACVSILEGAASNNSKEQTV